MNVEQPSREVRQIGGALSTFWASGAGPTDQRTQAAIEIAGALPADGPNKQARVRHTILQSDEQLARAVIEELLALLRESGYFHDPADEQVAKFCDAVASTSHSLTDTFHIDWAGAGSAVSAFSAGPTAPAGVAPITSSPATSLPAAATPSGGTPSSFPSSALAPTASVALASSPDLDLLCWSLRRLGLGAARPVIERRRNRSGLHIQDEWDVQDLVHLLLKALFSDVREEEPTPTSGGSSSRMEFLIPSLELGIELKVAKKLGDEKRIKSELLVDFNDFPSHHKVSRIAAAVYDFDGFMPNPDGFETDLSKEYNGVPSVVMVCPWVGPLTPPVGAKGPGVA